MNEVLDVDSMARKHSFTFIQTIKIFCAAKTVLLLMIAMATLSKIKSHQRKKFVGNRAAE